MNLIVVGPPGAGKGTQSKIICEKYNIPHISTGDLLREEIANESELGLEIKGIVNSGGLVGDDLITKLLKNRLGRPDCKNGFLLDGYPRTIAQGKELDKIVDKIDKVLIIDADDQQIIERMSGRRTCPSCSKVYHVTNNPPKTEGTCDECETDLIKRDDDAPEIVKNRLEKYHQATKPIIDFYKEKGKVYTVSGIGNVEDVAKQIFQLLEEA